MFRSRLLVIALLSLAASLLGPALASAWQGCGRPAPPLCRYPVVPPRVQPAVPPRVEQETPPEPPAPPAEVGAKKLHAVFLLDTKDPSIGADAASEGKSVEELLAKLPSSERHAFRVIQGSDLTARKVLTVLENLPVGPQETLFVYCNLHGARDEDGGQLL